MEEQTDIAGAQRAENIPSGRNMFTLITSQAWQIASLQIGKLAKEFLQKHQVKELNGFNVSVLTCNRNSSIRYKELFLYSDQRQKNQNCMTSPDFFLPLKTSHLQTTQPFACLGVGVWISKSSPIQAIEKFQVIYPTPCPLQGIPFHPSEKDKHFT